MFTFILRKMLNNKWMIISLLIGNILLTSTVASIPLYSDAILQRMLSKQFEQQQVETNKYPFSTELKFTSLSVNKGYEVTSLQNFENRISQMQQAIDLPALHRITIYQLTSSQCVSENGRASSLQSRMLSIQFMSDIENHINITRGRIYSDELNEDGAIEVIVSEKTLVEQDLLVGETMVFPQFSFSDGSPLKMVVVGTFENSEENDVYWYYSPATFADNCIMSQDLFMSLFIDDYYGMNFTGKWYLLTDYTALKSGDVQRVYDTSVSFNDSFAVYGTMACRMNYLDTLASFSDSASRLNTTLWVLQTPIFILLAFFVFMVSKQILEQEKNSIAVIKSRGASRLQVILIFLGQSAIIAGVSFAVGIPLGVLICRVLGASNGFLGLVSRSALPVSLNARAFEYTAIAAVLSVLTMVVPAFSYSKVTIVDHKRSTNAKSKSPLWQKLFLDVVLLGVSLYGLYSYNNQKDYLSSTAAESGAALDPLLFLSSSLFIIGAGLLFLRIFPLLMRLIFNIGKRWWSPAGYASFLKITRSMGEEQFIMLFLVLTLSIGIFNAKAARTINLNMEDGIRYDYGAPVVVMEQWSDNSSNDSAEMRIYKEPDFEKYAPLVEQGVKITKVQDTSNITSNNLKGIRLLGIDTKEFGEIAWFRDDLAPEHWYNYLNAMASDARAVLLSMNFHTELGYEIGSTISFRNINGTYFSGVVCGFVDYFPTYEATYTDIGRGGEPEEKQNYLIVANLAQVQSVFGVMPYEIWMGAEDTGVIYDFAEENGLRFESFLDADAAIVEEKNSPVLQGTNGVLTVGFIIILLVCFTGFLIYWILSIRSRTLQFGIFRAMGMSMRSILAMLANEQLCISGISIAMGTLIGYLASELYVPLIQLGYAAQGAIPLKVAAEGSDYLRLFTIIGIMLVVCVSILCSTISHIRIAQALKLGED